jgi:hypothetical protein
MRLAAVGRDVDHAVGLGYRRAGGACGGIEPDRNAEDPTPSPSSSGQPTTPSTSEPRRTSVTAVMNGDLLWHNTLWYGAREERPATRTWWL